MEVCKHHLPFKELTSTQNGTPTVRYPPQLCKKKTKKNKKGQQIYLATFVALQVWYGIPNERVPKSPLKQWVRWGGRVCVYKGVVCIQTEQKSQMLRLALIMRDGQTAEQLCLPQRSAKIYLAESNNY